VSTLQHVARGLIGLNAAYEIGLIPLFAVVQMTSGSRQLDCSLEFMTGKKNQLEERLVYGSQMQSST